MEVVKGLETRWEDLAVELRVIYTKRIEIKTGYHDEIRRMEEVMKVYVRYYPTRSWDDFAMALQRMGLRQHGDAVTDKYVRGMISGNVLSMVNTEHALYASIMCHCSLRDGCRSSTAGNYCHFSLLVLTLIQ